MVILLHTWLLQCCNSVELISAHILQGIKIQHTDKWLDLYHQGTEVTPLWCTFYQKYKLGLHYSSISNNRYAFICV